MSSDAQAKVADFPDVQESDWYYFEFSLFYSWNMIEGYPDGLFHPNESLTLAQCMKLLFYPQTTLSNVSTANCHWATPYMEKAFEYDVIDKSMYPETTWDKPISRYEISKIGYLYVVNRLQENDFEMYPGTDILPTKITDWATIPSEYHHYILQMYMKGIMLGYDDRGFHGEKQLTRAEACVLIMRITSQTNRIPFGSILL